MSGTDSVRLVRYGVRGWLRPDRPGEPAVVAEPRERQALVLELVLVFSVTLGLSGLRSLLSLLDSLLRPEPLSKQSVALNVSQAAQQLIDLAFQLAGVLQLVAWGGLAIYLLWRDGILPRMVGLDRRQIGRDGLVGAGLALLIGVPGIGLYLAAQALDLNLTVQPTTLGDHWWRTPVLILAAAGNAWAEEVLVVGYLLTRLRQLGWGENAGLLVSAVLRGSYHLYQGFGGFVGNLIMGLVFGRCWQRTNRLWPLVVAHTLLDVVAFVGYALLKGHVGWLP
ncbi:MAG TPA: CPBP family intramembrane glutamic endopeptidase [Actinopolymorphaceae bacterium]|nr:CPBP family intramembrane glutamic endopeptidase [Actinopolymorphaceae bacterium]